MDTYGSKTPPKDMSGMDGAMGGVATPRDGMTEKPGMDTQEDCVPLTALASPGEDEMMTNPSEGDLVQYQKEGKVTRIEGDNAYVKVNSVNGKPMTMKDAVTKDTPDQQGDAELASLKEAAQGRIM